MSTNIGYWEKVLNAPTPAYRELFDAEHKYLVEDIPANSKVLDIGCGEGRNIRSVLEVTPNVYGVDNDIKAVEEAKKNLPNVQIVQGEATNLPYEDKTFDVVTLLMTLVNLDSNKEKVLREITRVLNDDGFLILSIFSETAFEERMEIYKLISVPIKQIDGTRVIFDDSVGANTSEQFSLEEIEKLAKTAGLKISESNKIGSIALICKLEKIK